MSTAIQWLRDDAVAPVDDADLEDAVWMEVLDLLDRGALPTPVMDWFLTRLSLWETWNGGHAQLVANDLDDLPAMIDAWGRVGEPRVAAAFRAVLDRAGSLGFTPGGDAPPWEEVSGRFDDLDEAHHALLDTVYGFHVGLLRAHRDAFERALGG